MFLGDPAWSPDGKHVAWVAGPPNGYGTVWVSDASGQNARPLHQFGQSLLGYDFVQQIEWLSPTSLLVGAVVSNVSGLYQLSLSSQVTLVSLLPDPAFSTDRARRLVATDGPNCSPTGDCPSRVDILHLASGKVTRAGSRHELDTWPALSPNGKRVAYERSVCHPRCGNFGGDIWLAPTSGDGKPRQIAHDAACCGQIWSPDGRIIAYGYQTRKGVEGLAFVRPGQRPRKFPRLGIAGAFSPDSRLLALTSGSSNSSTGHLVVLDFRAHRAVLVSPRWLGDVGVDNQAWSPDGKKLIVVARPTDACTSLYMVTLSSQSWTPFRACE